MYIDKYSSQGRTLLVQFKCGRCGFELCKPFEEVDNDDVDGFINRIKPPEGWEDLHGCILLCDACYEHYKQFMANKR